jgi:hypothetical protein
VHVATRIHLISNCLPISKGWSACKGTHISTKLNSKLLDTKATTRLTEADRSAVCQCIIQQVFYDSGMVFLCIECGVVIDPNKVQRALYQISLTRREPW